jgi:hypothetical protein
VLFIKNKGLLAARLEARYNRRYDVKKGKGYNGL